MVHLPHDRAGRSSLFAVVGPGLSAEEVNQGFVFLVQMFGVKVCLLLEFFLIRCRSSPC